MKTAILLTAGVLVFASSNAVAQPGPAVGGLAPMMSKMDVNGDGFVSDVEHREWAAKTFATMDTNKDGKLSREEYLSVHMGPGPRGAGNDAQMQARRQQADARKAKQFSAMDTDKDGFATRTEFLANADRNFAAKDVNKDGKLSASEIRTGRESW